MFTSGMVECREQVIVIRDIRGEILQILIDFCYTRPIPITNGNIDALLAGASHLALDGVMEACSEYLTKQLTPATCMSIHTKADKFSLTKLLELSLECICENFAEMIESNEYKNLTSTQLLGVLKYGELDVSGMDVVSAIIKWIEFDKLNRVAHGPQLMRAIQLQNLSSSVR